jgi:hypothetical protein
MPHTRLIALALAATTLAAAGCGGSSTRSSSSPKTPASAERPVTGTPTSPTPSKASVPSGPLTRADLIARADAICKRLNLRARSITTTSLRTVGTTALTVAGYYRTALTELHKLTPSASMAGAWRALLADIAPVPSEATVMGRYALDNDIKSTVRVETHLGKIQRRRIALARHAGFKDCAET